MDRSELEKVLYEQDRRYLVKNQLPNHNELLSALRSLIPTTGNLSEMFCNAFFSESVELLKHAFFLYEDGFFDCAFYSVRQAIENMNNMLLSASDSETFKLWKSKGRFPSDKVVKDSLIRQNTAYNEIKATIPEFFDEYNELLKKANKYIHKQGFDTFYAYNYDSEIKNYEERTTLFLSFFKYAIGMLLIMDIVLDPLSLALSDYEVDSHIPFDPMTEPIPLRVFEKYLSLDIVEKIKSTSHYTEIRDYFLDMEELNDSTYAVLRCNHFDVDQLDRIERQIHLLSLSEKLMFCMLKCGIKATHFYWDYSILGYSTSHNPTVILHEWTSNQFDGYLNDKDGYNLAWRGMYISVYNALDSYLIVQHNEPLTEDEIRTTQRLVEAANQRAEHIMDEILVNIPKN